MTKTARTIPFAWAMAMWAVLSLAITLLGVHMGYGGTPYAIAILTLAVLFAGEIFSAAYGFRKTVKELLGPAGLVLLPLGLSLLYWVYLEGIGGFSWARLLGALAWIELPALLGLSSRGRPAGTWQDYATLVVLWAPIEFAWGRALFPYPLEATHTMEILLALNAGIICFLYLRDLEGIGYTITWGPGFATAVIVNFAIFAAIAIPLGEWMHFISWAPSLAKLKILPISLLGIMFFTAWPEEFLFRGLLQNMLSKTFRSDRIGWIVASGIFGLSHIVHGFPNWKYVLLAAIAGLFYGTAWMKTKSMTADCLVHTLVDTIWHLLF